MTPYRHSPLPPLDNQAAKRTLYRYSSLPREQNSVSIRLLRLIPNKDARAAIKCQLFDYPIESSKRTHLYEALSYVWGNPNKTVPIFIGEHCFYVTENLHAALIHLRNHSIDRILWVDAICINQADDQEKAHQIQRMAKIYGQANRVVVWLGDPANGSLGDPADGSLGDSVDDSLGDAENDSDQVFEYIRAAAEDESKNSRSNKPSERAILKLLTQPWFRRIWVLQEVAAARRILMMYGSAEMTGHAFCSGFNKLELSHETRPLQSLIRSVTYLIRKAIFRPRYTTRPSGGESLGELMDMYHTREATKRHDKVYALLGMSSDDSQRIKAAGLSPDYAVSWKELLRRLVKFLLKEVSVETWDESEMAVIKSKGYILGQVSSVENHINRYDKQHVDITFKTPKGLEFEELWGARWTLQASAKSIQRGDLVCLLQGASKPTIIRTRKDHSEVIILAVTHLQGEQTESGHSERQELSASTESFLREFLLTWDLGECLDHLQNRAGYETLVPEDVKVSSGKATELYNMALILRDLGEYKESQYRLQEAVEGYKKTSGEEHPHTLAATESLALVYKDQQEWKKAEELFSQVIQTRRRLKEMIHQDILNSIANLASSYVDQGRSSAGTSDMMADLVNRIRHNVQIPEQEAAQVARSFDQKFLTLLLELERDSFMMTEEIVKAAAGNEGKGHVMALLVERRGDDVIITEEVVKAAVGNKQNGWKIMTLLLEQRGNNIPITEEVAKIAAGNVRNGKEVITLLLERRGNNFPITEEVFKAAAGNEESGHEVMAILLEQTENDVLITEEVVKAAAGNEGRGRKVMELLFEQRGDNILITEGVVQAAARNKWNGKEVIELLLEQRRDILITEGVVEAVAENWLNGKEVMELLLKQGGDDITVTEEAIVQIARLFNKAAMTLLLKRRGDIPITEGVVQAAAGNEESGKEVMVLLFKRLGGNNSLITERVVKAAAGNKWNGKEVMELLLERRGDIPITEGVVQAAAGNGWNGKEVIELLLKRRGDIPITEGVFQAAAGNEWNWKGVMELLLERTGDIPITEGVVQAAAGNEWNGKEVMELLLKQRGDILITEGVVQAAAGNKESGREVMMLLLGERGGNILITAEAEVEIAKWFDDGVVRGFYLSEEGPTSGSQNE